MRNLLRNFQVSLFATLLVAVAGCAVFAPVSVKTGDPESEVVAKLGAPSNRYQDGKDHLLEYAKGPWGQQTYMARFGPDGKLISYEQVLSTEKFASIKIDKSTKNDILLTIGAPSETSYLRLSQLEVWSYPYKESGVWNSLMHVHFDLAGVVQRMQSGPDPRYDPDRRFPFGMLH